MKTFLKSVNLFTQTVSFNFYKNKEYHSFFGLILSVFMYLLMIYFAIYFSDDFINKKHTRLLFKEKEFQGNINTYLQSFFEEISINLQILTNQDDIGNYFRSKNASVSDFIQLQIYFEDQQLELINNNGTDFIVQKNFKMNLTLKEDARNSTFKLNNKKITYKRKIDLNSKFFLRSVLETAFQNGTVFYSEMNIINDQILKDLNFSITKNTKIDFRILINDKYNLNTTETTLKIDEDLSEIFDDIEYSIPYFTRKFKSIDNILDFDLESFFKNLTNEYNHVSRSIKIGNVMLSRTVLYELIQKFDDKDPIFLNRIADWRFHRKESSTSNKYVEYNKPIIFISVRFDNVMKIYERNYKKLQNVLADLGGVFSTFIFLGNMLVQNFNMVKFNYDAINHIFNKDEDIKNNV